MNNSVNVEHRQNNMNTWQVHLENSMQKASKNVRLTDYMIQYGN